MPNPRRTAGLAAAAMVLSLAACSHGGGDKNGSRPRTNIDLAVTNFAVSPDASDADDALTLTGTIQNLGSETANPLQGDSFILRFNLSVDGTFEFNEQGFWEKKITDPIPPGGSITFSESAPFGGGDTQSVFGNFCTSQSCAPPEIGIIGVDTDALDDIRELDEGNNFQFVNHEVVGTRVGASLATCDFGTTNPSGPGCNLFVSDGLFSTTMHFPCSGGGCTATPVLLPNELHQYVSLTLQLKGCTTTVCGWGVTITAETQKPGLPVDKIQQQLVCNAFSSNGPDATCNFTVKIRDDNY